MRTITKKAVEAFLAGQTFSLDNTSVTVGVEDGNPFAYLRLNGNLIARHDIAVRKIEISTAGWNTLTTRERLNGIPGVKIRGSRMTGTLFLNDKPWDGSWTTVDANGNTTPS